MCLCPSQVEVGKNGMLSSYSHHQYKNNNAPSNGVRLQYNWCRNPCVLAYEPILYGRQAGWTDRVTKWRLQGGSTDRTGSSVNPLNPKLLQWSCPYSHVDVSVATLVLPMMTMQPRWHFRVATLLQQTRRCKEPSLPMSSLVGDQHLQNGKQKNMRYIYNRCTRVWTFLLCTEPLTKSIHKQCVLVHKIHANVWDVILLDTRVARLGVIHV